MSRLACALKPRTCNSRVTRCGCPGQNMRSPLGCGSGRCVAVRMKGTCKPEAIQRSEHVCSAQGKEPGKPFAGAGGGSLCMSTQASLCSPSHPCLRSGDSPSSSQTRADSGTCSLHKSTLPGTPSGGPLGSLTQPAWKYVLLSNQQPSCCRLCKTERQLVLIPWPAGAPQETKGLEA